MTSIFRGFAIWAGLLVGLLFGFFAVVTVASPAVSWACAAGQYYDPVANVCVVPAPAPPVPVTMCIGAPVPYVPMSWCFPVGG